MKPTDIQWPNVLGPLTNASVCSTPEAIAELTQAIQRNPPRAVRLAVDCSPDDLPFATQPVPWFDRGRILSSSDVRPGAFLHHAAGCYYIQDAGSLLAIGLCNIQPGDIVCDLCAAPGGKSTALLEQLDGTGLLLSNEVIGARLAPLTSALWRTGYHNHLTTSRDSERLEKVLPEAFNCVLVDAPCSGQSMLSRGKQSIASFSEHQISHSAARQARIVRSAAALVAPGGRLVYSTCTFAYEENEQIIQQFLSEHPDWTIAPPTAGLEQWESPIAGGCYRLWPHVDPCAGGFAAALVRSDSASEPNYSRVKKPKWQSLKVIPPQVAGWFDEPPELDSAAWFQYGDRIQITSRLATDAMLGIAYAGTPIATQKLNRWDPDYPGALLRAPELQAAETFDLDDDQAALFVSGQPLRLPATTQPSASRWCRVAWRGRSLSWGKLAGGMLKNHVPKPIRQKVSADGT